jgi:hypothetical protein
VNIWENHFVWRADKTDDGKTWQEFMGIEAHRIKTQEPAFA